MTNKPFSVPGCTSGRCCLCPRMCAADRGSRSGFCGAGEEIEVSKIMLHHWEEPPVSGPDPTDEGHGSGAVFFAHCSLGCVYCQNGKISRPASRGIPYSPDALADEFLALQSRGAYNVNLVSPTHYADRLADTVDLARERGLTVPVVWNTGGYERPETIDALAERGTADVWLTDFKYASPESAERWSRARNYPETAAASLVRMVGAAGPCVFSPDGMMKRGVIVRHLVLPGRREESIAVLRTVASLVGEKSVRLSLMAQYTPDFLPAPPDPGNGQPDPYRSIRRKVTTYEYEKVVEEAARLGFEGWTQERSSATKRFTPDF